MTSVIPTPGAAPTAPAPPPSTRTRRDGPRVARGGPSWRVPALAALGVGMIVVLGRLPFLNAPLGKDEAGYLTVGGQWHGSGPLYGGYFVDRPPLLIAIFEVAARLGGAVPLRLLGLLGVLVTVAATADAAHSIVTARAGAAGARKAAAVTALVTAAWLVSPLSGSREIDGELLAAPFIAVGIAAALRALMASDRTRAVAAAAVSGLAGMCAVLVKQNMIDVVVFGVVLAGLSLRTLGARRVAGVAAAALTGAVAAASAVAAWTLAHGTSLSGVWYAMYPFRSRAGEVMAAHPSPYAAGRAMGVLAAFGLSGLAVAFFALLALAIVTVVRRRSVRSIRDRQGAIGALVPIALGVLAAYDVVSIAMGGSFWIHYLVQLVVPCGIAAGLATAKTRWQSRLQTALVGVVAVSSLVAGVAAGVQTRPDQAARLGAAIGQVSRPGDTIVSYLGDANLVRSSGLRTPYRYLWSLPARTLDTRAATFSATLLGPHPATWVVSFSGVRPHLSGVDTTHLNAVLASHYHVVGHVTSNGRATVVFLRDGVHRQIPSLLSPAY